MSKMRITINVPGFNEARNDPRIQERLHAMGDRAAQAAGGSPDFEVIDSPSKSRARVVVVAATPAGRRAEATDRVLTRAFDAARG